MAGEFLALRNHISYSALSAQYLWSLEYHPDSGDPIDFAAHLRGDHFEVFGDEDNPGFKEIREDIRNCLDEGIRDFRLKPKVRFINDPGSVGIVALGGGSVELSVALADGSRLSATVLLTEEDGRLVMRGYSPASADGIMPSKLIGQLDVEITRPFDRLGAVLGYGEMAGEFFAEEYQDALLHRYFVTEFQGRRFRPRISSTHLGDHRYQVHIEGGGSSFEIGVYLARDDEGRPIAANTDPVPVIPVHDCLPRKRTPLEILDHYRADVTRHLDEQERRRLFAYKGLYVYEAPGQRYEESLTVSNGKLLEVRKVGEIDDRRFTELTSYRDGNPSRSKSRRSMANGDGASIEIERLHFNDGRLMQESYLFSMGGFTHETDRRWLESGMLERSSSVTTDAMGRQSRTIATYDAEGIEISRETVRTDKGETEAQGRVVSMRKAFGKSLQGLVGPFKRRSS